MKETFEWDEEKNITNTLKHKISFHEAQKAFADEFRVILQDIEHSETEVRYYCLGKLDQDILTVRFTFRNNKIRIFGAGYWRKGKRIYEQKNNLQ